MWWQAFVVVMVAVLAFVGLASLAFIAVGVVLWSRGTLPWKSLVAVVLFRGFVVAVSVLLIAEAFGADVGRALVIVLVPWGVLAVGWRLIFVRRDVPSTPEDPPALSSG